MSLNLSTRDVMSKNVATLSPEMNLEEAWALLSKYKISGAPVVGENGNLMGILSQTDLAREAFLKHFSGFRDDFSHNMTSYFQDLGEAPLPDFFKRIKITDIMNQDVLTASVTEPVSAIAKKMRQHHVHRIVIVDREKVVGIVSALDLLSLIN
jgi:CBS domain-containing protein